MREVGRIVCAVLLASSIIAGGCGEAAPLVDADTPDGGDAATIVTPPAIPWLSDDRPPVAPPAISPCRAGWSEAAVDGLVECDPYPGGRDESCAEGEAHFPGEAGCRPIGAPCPTSTFSPDLPAGSAVVYVDSAASPGGDGTRAAPHAALSDVSWSSLASGTTVALARGSYDGTLPLPAGVSVVGACVAETILVGTTAPVTTLALVTSGGDPASIRNVTIRDSEQIGAEVERGRSLQLRGVLIEQMLPVGFYASDPGSTAVLEDVVVRNTRSLSSGEAGNGVTVTNGASVDATRVMVIDNRGSGIFVTGGSTVTLTDGVIAGTRGPGLYVEEASHIATTGLLIEGNDTLGFFVDGDGSMATVADTIVRGTMPRGDDLFGIGVEVFGGARFEAARLVVEGSHNAAVAVVDGAVVHLEDAVLRDTLPHQFDLDYGRGVNVQSGGVFSGERLVLRNNRDVGFNVEHAGSAATISDVVIADTESREVDGDTGQGLEVDLGGHLEATRLVIERNRNAGMHIYGADTTVALSDVLIDGTRGRLYDGHLGRGIGIEGGATVTIERMLSSDNGQEGIFAFGSNVTLRDIVVRQTVPGEPGRPLSRGIQAQLGALVTGQRIRVEGATGIGIACAPQSLMELSDVFIGDVARVPCAPGTCAELGYGAASVDGALRLTRFEVTRAEVCGVFLAGSPTAMPPEPSLDLRTGRVSGAAIGACIQVDGYDVARLSDDVIYVDNGVNLDATTLPVPEPTMAIGADETP
jgi:hypothetical protein